MTAFPEWIEPMAATLTYARYAGPEWLRLVGIREDKVAREVVREAP